MKGSPVALHSPEATAQASATSASTGFAAPSQRRAPFRPSSFASGNEPTGLDADASGLSLSSIEHSAHFGMSDSPPSPQTRGAHRQPGTPLTRALARPLLLLDARESGGRNVAMGSMARKGMKRRVSAILMQEGGAVYDVPMLEAAAGGGDERPAASPACKLARRPSADVPPSLWGATSQVRSTEQHAIQMDSSPTRLSLC